MSRSPIHKERHRLEIGGSLRAAALGANDGIVSVSSLLLGIAAASGDRTHILIGGVAALVGGAMSMAAGEYISVSAQRDLEQAELNTERRELEDDPVAEEKELAAIYEGRGLSKDLAAQVARQLMDADPLGAHARDELGISDQLKARPISAAIASATSFTAGAILPLSAAYLSPAGMIQPIILASCLLALVLLGYLAGKAGSQVTLRGIARVVFWGLAAMGITWLTGHLFNGVVG
ncbi:VIT1/CCC1 transporter family protein [Aurantiacibacter rhizosphaerae]|uniref:VIT family protein n=1 Tax=Aurantiacibacter rhizosphaerae TaxID=2691582 RepID=A0A844XI58_9SPHN|nr:VIT family protein [Aurantiacibacter rhizosphaerae]MWV29245.1 VIT family protein [Aurantiacibacter rhizosphaerae]